MISSVRSCLFNRCQTSFFSYVLDMDWRANISDQFVAVHWDLSETLASQTKGA